MTPKKENVIQAIAHIRDTSEAKVTFTADYRINLAYPHLSAAIEFSKAVINLEKKHEGKEFGAFWEDIQANAIACVLTSVASVEAYSNEIYADMKDLLGHEAASEIDNYAVLFSRDPGYIDIISKFDLFLYAKTRVRLDKSIKPVQNLSALIDLRNAITHYKPEWESNAKNNARISSKLKGKFKPTTLFPAGNEGIFPRRWASASCTQWAVQSVLSFTREFERLAQLPDKFPSIENKL